MISKRLVINIKMTDIGASLLLESIKEFKKNLKHRRNIFNIYKKDLSKNKKIHVVDKDGPFEHSNWLFTIILKKERSFAKDP